MLQQNNSPHQPVIGITGSSPDSKSVKNAIRQITVTGAIPMFLCNHGKRNAAEDIDKIDGLMVLGNNSDIDPARYGQPRNLHTKSEHDTPEGQAREGYEYELLQLALNRKMPVMGVCAGMQRINVMLGGDLHQHVPDLIGHNEHAQQDYKVEGYVPVQPVFIQKDSKLADIAADINTVYTPDHTPTPPTMLLENSMHHQAVNHVGKGLRAVAHGDDMLPDDHGKPTPLIEAIEADPNGPYKDQFLVAVQWHPEFGASPLGERLANSLKDAAANYAKDHDQQHEMQSIMRENMISSLPANVPAPRPGSMTEMVLSKRFEQNQATYGLSV
jgi:putative glutamine amidotransferase